MNSTLNPKNDRTLPARWAAVQRWWKKEARPWQRFWRHQHRRIISSIVVVTFTFTMTGLDRTLAYAFDDRRLNQNEQQEKMPENPWAAAQSTGFVEQYKPIQNADNAGAGAISVTSMNVLKAEYGDLVDATSLQTIAGKTASGMSLDAAVVEILGDKGKTGDVAMPDTVAKPEAGDLKAGGTADKAALADAVTLGKGPLSLSLELGSSVHVSAKGETAELPSVVPGEGGKELPTATGDKPQVAQKVDTEQTQEPKADQAQQQQPLSGQPQDNLKTGDPQVTVADKPGSKQPEVVPQNKEENKDQQQVVNLPAKPKDGDTEVTGTEKKDKEKKGDNDLKNLKKQLMALLGTDDREEEDTIDVASLKREEAGKRDTSEAEDIADKDRDDTQKVDPGALLKGDDERAREDGQETVKQAEQEPSQALKDIAVEKPAETEADKTAEEDKVAVQNTDKLKPETDGPALVGPEATERPEGEMPVGKAEERPDVTAAAVRAPSGAYVQVRPENRPDLNATLVASVGMVPAASTNNTSATPNMNVTQMLNQGVVAITGPQPQSAQPAVQRNAQYTQPAKNQTPAQVGVASQVGTQSTNPNLVLMQSSVMIGNQSQMQRSTVNQMPNPPTIIDVAGQAVAAASGRQSTIPPQPNPNTTPNISPWTGQADSTLPPNNLSNIFNHPNSPEPDDEGGGSCAGFLGSTFGKIFMFVIQVVMTVFTCGACLPLLIAMILLLALTNFVPMPQWLSIGLSVLTAALGGWASALGNLGQIGTVTLKAAIDALKTALPSILKAAIAAGIVQTVMALFGEDLGVLGGILLNVLAGAVAGGITDALLGKLSDVFSNFASGFMKALKEQFGDIFKSSTSNWSAAAILTAPIIKTLVGAAVEIAITEAMGDDPYAGVVAAAAGAFVSGLMQFGGDTLKGSVTAASTSSASTAGRIWQSVLLPTVTAAAQSFYSTFVGSILQSQGYGQAQISTLANQFAGIVGNVLPNYNAQTGNWSVPIVNMMQNMHWGGGKGVGGQGTGNQGTGNGMQGSGKVDPFAQSNQTQVAGQVSAASVANGAAPGENLDVAPIPAMEGPGMMPAAQMDAAKNEVPETTQIESPAPQEDVMSQTPPPPQPEEDAGMRSGAEAMPKPEPKKEEVQNPAPVQAPMEKAPETKAPEPAPQQAPQEQPLPQQKEQPDQQQPDSDYQRNEADYQEPNQRQEVAQQPEKAEIKDLDQPGVRRDGDVPKAQASGDNQGSGSGEGGDDASGAGNSQAVMKEAKAVAEGLQSGTLQPQQLGDKFQAVSEVETKTMSASDAANQKELKPLIDNLRKEGLLPAEATLKVTTGLNAAGQNTVQISYTPPAANAGAGFTSAAAFDKGSMVNVIAKPAGAGQMQASVYANNTEITKQEIKVSAKTIQSLSDARTGLDQRQADHRKEPATRAEAPADKPAAGDQAQAQAAAMDGQKTPAAALAGEQPAAAGSQGAAKAGEAFKAVVEGQNGEKISVQGKIDGQTTRQVVEGSDGNGYLVDTSTGKAVVIGRERLVGNFWAKVQGFQMYEGGQLSQDVVVFNEHTGVKEAVFRDNGSGTFTLAEKTYSMERAGQTLTAVLPVGAEKQLTQQAMEVQILLSNQDAGTLAQNADVVQALKDQGISVNSAEGRQALETMASGISQEAYQKAQALVASGSASGNLPAAETLLAKAAQQYAMKATGEAQRQAFQDYVQHAVRGSDPVLAAEAAQQYSRMDAGQAAEYAKSAFTQAMGSNLAPDMKANVALQTLETMKHTDLAGNAQNQATVKQANDYLNSYFAQAAQAAPETLAQAVRYNALGGQVDVKPLVDQAGLSAAMQKLTAAQPETKIGDATLSKLETPKTEGKAEPQAQQYTLTQSDEGKQVQTTLSVDPKTQEVTVERVTTSDAKGVIESVENHGGQFELKQQRITAAVMINGKSTLQTMTVDMPGEGGKVTGIVKQDKMLVEISVDLKTNQATVVNQMSAPADILRQAAALDPSGALRVVDGKVLLANGQPAPFFENMSGHEAEVAGLLIQSGLDRDQAKMMVAALQGKHDLYLAGSTVFIGTAAQIEAGDYQVAGRNTFSQGEALLYIAEYKGDQLQTLNLSDHRIVEFENNNLQNYTITLRSSDGKQVLVTKYENGQLVGGRLGVNNVNLFYDQKDSLTAASLEALKAGSGKEGYTLKAATGGFVLEFTNGEKYAFTEQGRPMKLPEAGGTSAGQQEMIEFDVHVTLNLNIAKANAPQGTLVRLDTLAKQTVTLQAGANGHSIRTVSISNGLSEGLVTVVDDLKTHAILSVNGMKLEGKLSADQAALLNKYAGYLAAGNDYATLAGVHLALSAGENGQAHLDQAAAYAQKSGNGQVILYVDFATATQMLKAGNEQAALAKYRSIVERLNQGTLGHEPLAVGQMALQIAQELSQAKISPEQSKALIGTALQMAEKNFMLVDNLEAKINGLAQTAALSVKHGDTPRADSIVASLVKVSSQLSSDREKLNLAGMLSTIGTTKAMQNALTMVRKLEPASNMNLTASEKLYAAQILFDAQAKKEEVQAVLSTVDQKLVNEPLNSGNATFKFNYHLLSAKVAGMEATKASHYRQAMEAAVDDGKRMSLLAALNQDTSRDKTWQQAIVRAAVEKFSSEFWNAADSRQKAMAMIQDISSQISAVDKGAALKMLSELQTKLHAEYDKRANQAGFKESAAGQAWAWDMRQVDVLTRVMEVSLGRELPQTPGTAHVEAGQKVPMAKAVDGKIAGHPNLRFDVTYDENGRAIRWSTKQTFDFGGVSLKGATFTLDQKTGLILVETARSVAPVMVLGSNDPAAVGFEGLKDAHVLYSRQGSTEVYYSFNQTGEMSGFVVNGSQINAVNGSKVVHFGNNGQVLDAKGSGGGSAPKYTRIDITYSFQFTGRAGVTTAANLTTYQFKQVSHQSQNGGSIVTNTLQNVNFKTMSSISTYTGGAQVISNGRPVYDSRGGKIVINNLTRATTLTGGAVVLGKNGQPQMNSMGGKISIDARGNSTLTGGAVTLDAKGHVQMESRSGVIRIDPAGNVTLTGGAVTKNADGFVQLASGGGTVTIVNGKATLTGGAAAYGVGQDDKGKAFSFKQMDSTTKGTIVIDPSGSATLTGGAVVLSQTEKIQMKSETGTIKIGADKTVELTGGAMIMNESGTDPQMKSMTGTIAIGADQSVTLTGGAVVMNDTGKFEQMKSMGGTIVIGADKSITLTKGAVVMNETGSAEQMRSLGGTIVIGADKSITLTNGAMVMNENNPQLKSENGKIVIGADKSITLSGGAMAMQADGKFAQMRSNQGTIRIAEDRSIRLSGGAEVMYENSDKVRMASNHGEITISANQKITLTGDAAILDEQGKISLDARKGTVVIDRQQVMIDGKLQDVQVISQNGVSTVTLGEKQIQMQGDVHVSSADGKLIQVTDSRGVTDQYTSGGQKETGWWQSVKNTFSEYVAKVEAAAKSLGDAIAKNHEFARSFDGVAAVGAWTLAVLADVGQALIWTGKVLLAETLLIVDLAGKAFSAAVEWGVNLTNPIQAITHYMETGRSLGRDSINELAHGLEYVFEHTVDAAFKAFGEFMEGIAEDLTVAAEQSFAEGNWALGSYLAVSAAAYKIIGENAMIITLVVVSAAFPVVGSILGTLVLAKDAIVQGLGAMAQTFFVDPFIKVGAGLAHLTMALMGKPEAGVSSVRSAINAMAELGSGAIGVVFARQMTKAAFEKAAANRMEVLLSEAKNELRKGLESGRIKVEDLPAMKVHQLMETVLGKEKNSLQDMAHGREMVGELSLKSGEGMVKLSDLLKQENGKALVKDLLSAKDFKFGDLKMEVPAPKENLIKQTIDLVMPKRPAGPNTLFKGLTQVMKPGELGMTMRTVGLRGMGEFTRTFAKEFVNHQAEQFIQAGKSMQILGERTMNVAGRISEVAQSMGLTNASLPVRSQTSQSTSASSKPADATRSAAAKEAGVARPEVAKVSMETAVGQTAVSAEVAKASARTAAVEKAVAQSRQNLTQAGDVSAEARTKLEQKVANAEKALSRAQAEEVKLKDLETKQQQKDLEAVDTNRTEGERAQAGLESAALTAERAVAPDQFAVQELAGKIENMRGKGETSESNPQLRGMEQKLDAMKRSLERTEKMKSLDRKMLENQQKAESLKNEIADTLTKMSESQNSGERDLQRSRAMRLEKELESTEAKQEAAAQEQKVLDLEGRLEKAGSATQFMDLLRQKGEAQQSYAKSNQLLKNLEKQLERAQTREAKAELRALLSKALVDKSEGQVRNAVNAVAKATAEGASQAPLVKALAQALATGGELPREVMEQFQGATARTRLRALAENGLGQAGRKILEQMCKQSGIHDSGVIAELARQLKIADPRGTSARASAEAVNAAADQLFGTKNGYSSLMSTAEARAFARSVNAALEKGFESLKSGNPEQALAETVANKLREAAGETNPRGSLQESLQALLKHPEVLRAADPLKALLDLRKQQAGTGVQEAPGRAGEVRETAGLDTSATAAEARLVNEIKKMASNLTPEQYRKLLTAEKPLDALESVRQEQAKNAQSVGELQAKLEATRVENAADLKAAETRAEELRQRGETEVMEKMKADADLTKLQQEAKTAATEAEQLGRNADNLAEQVKTAQAAGKPVENLAVALREARTQAQNAGERAKQLETAAADKAARLDAEVRSTREQFQSQAEAVMKVAQAEAQNKIKAVENEISQAKARSLLQMARENASPTAIDGMLKRAHQIQAAENQQRLAAARMNEATTLKAQNEAARAMDQAEIAKQEKLAMAQAKPDAGASWNRAESKVRAASRMSRVKEALVKELTDLNTKASKLLAESESLANQLRDAELKLKEAAESERANFQDALKAKEGEVAANSEARAKLEQDRAAKIDRLLTTSTNLQYRFMDIGQESVRNEIIAGVKEARSNPNYKAVTLNQQIYKALADCQEAISKPGAKFEARDKQLAFAYKIAEHMVLTHQLRSMAEIKKAMGGEGLRLAAGYGKEFGNAAGLVAAYKIIKAQSGRAPKFMFATSMPDLVGQMATNALMKTMGAEVIVVKKDTVLADPKQGGIYLLDQKTGAELLLEAKSGNKAKAEFLDTFDGFAVDEVQAALSATPVIHGISGAILEKVWQKLPEASVKSALHQAALRTEAMRESLRVFNADGLNLQVKLNDAGACNQFTVTRETAPGASQRDTAQFITKNKIVDALLGKKMFEGVSRQEISRMVDLCADAVMKINGRDYHGVWEKGEFDYSVMGNGQLMLHTVFGNSELAAMVAIKESFMLKLKNDISLKNAQISLDGTAKRLLHFKTGEANFMEMMNRIGLEKGIVGSATLQGNRLGLENLDYRITSLTGESELCMNRDVTIEGLSKNEPPSRSVGARDQILFKLDNVIYEFKDGQTREVARGNSASDFLVDRLLAERVGSEGEGRKHHLEVVTDIDNGKNSRVFERVVERLGDKANVITNLEELRAAASKPGTDVILIKGFDGELRTAMIEEVGKQITENSTKPRIVVAVGLGEGSNMMKFDNAMKAAGATYSGTIWKTNLEDYAKMAQTARRRGAPGRVEDGVSRMFIDLDTETKVRTEEVGKIRGLVEKGSLLGATDYLIETVSRTILKEIDQNQASSIEKMRQGISTSDVVTVVEKSGQPSAAEIQRYTAKALEIVAGMEARTQGLQAASRNASSWFGDRAALKSGVEASRQEYSLLKGYMDKFTAETPGQPGVVAAKMANQFGADWNTRLQLGQLQLSPENYRQDFGVYFGQKYGDWRATALRWTGVTALVSAAANRVYPSLSNWWNLNKAQGLVASGKQDYVGYLQDVKQVTEQLPLLERESQVGAVVTYKGNTMDLKQAQNYVQQQLAMSQQLARQYGITDDVMKDVAKKPDLAVQMNKLGPAVAAQMETMAGLDRGFLRPLQQAYNAMERGFANVGFPLKPALKIAGSLTLALASLQVVGLSGLTNGYNLLVAGGGLLSLLVAKSGIGQKGQSNVLTSTLQGMQSGKLGSMMSMLSFAGIAGGAIAQNAMFVMGGLVTVAPKVAGYVKEFQAARRALANRQPDTEAAVISYRLEEPVAAVAAGTKGVLQAYQAMKAEGKDAYASFREVLGELNVGFTLAPSARQEAMLQVMAALFDLIPAIQAPQAGAVVPRVWSQMRQAKPVIGRETGIRDVRMSAQAGEVAETGVIQLSESDLGFLNQTLTEQMVKQMCRAAGRMLLENAGEHLKVMLHQHPRFSHARGNELAEFIRQYIMEGQALRQALDESETLRTVYGEVKEAFGGKEFSARDLSDLNAATLALENETAERMKAMANAIEAQSGPAWRTIKIAEFEESFHPVSYAQYRTMQAVSFAERLLGRTTLKAVEQSAAPVSTLKAAGRQMAGLGAGLLLAGALAAGFAFSFVPLALGTLAAVLAGGGAFLGYQGLAIQSQATKLAFKLNPTATVKEQLFAARFASTPELEAMALAAEEIQRRPELAAQFYPRFGVEYATYQAGNYHRLSMASLMENWKFRDAVEHLKLQASSQTIISENKRTVAIQEVLEHIKLVAKLDMPGELRMKCLVDAVMVLEMLDYKVKIDRVSGPTVELTPVPGVRPIFENGIHNLGQEIEALKGLGIIFKAPVYENMKRQQKLKLAGSAA